jgi:hypothetical protein
MKKKALSKSRQIAVREFKHFSLGNLQLLARSPRSNDRLLALLLMIKQIKEGDKPLAIILWPNLLSTIQTTTAVGNL